LCIRLQAEDCLLMVTGCCFVEEVFVSVVESVGGWSACGLFVINCLVLVVVAGMIVGDGD
jgi:NAD/NADP transhydrogenase beta subunit